MAENGSLLSADFEHNASKLAVQKKDQQRFGMKMKIFLMILVAISISIITIAIFVPLEQIYNGEPIKIRMLLPPQSPFIMINGQNRVLDLVFYSGNDDRMSDNFRLVSKREVLWSVNPQGVVKIDQYGTLQTLNEGSAMVTVRSFYNPSILDQRLVKVISKKSSYLDNNTFKMQKVDFKAIPVAVNKVLQKIVSFYTKQQALNLAELPESIKNYINDPLQSEVKKQIIQRQAIQWRIVEYADGSNRTFIKRLSPNEKNERDKEMALIGNRYLPGQGFQAVSIEDDSNLGLWVVNSDGQVSRIEMREISHRQKARIMTKNTEKYVQRHGLSADSTFNGQKWVGSISDNDGLWTGMFAAGQLMRYASLKQAKASEQEISQARESALRPLKAVLLTSNVACRNKTIDAKIRHYLNSVKQKGAFLSNQFLLKNKSYSTESYPGSPADGVGLFGIQAGNSSDQYYIGGKKKFTYLPFNPKDWSNDIHSSAATTKRTLEGFWARTFVIEPLEKVPGTGLYFKHNEDGTQTVLSNADVLYDYTKDQHPILDLGSTELPEILKSILLIEGTQYNKSDLIYKGDTSTDEVIGHLFLYKIAFDVLSDQDAEEKALKDLIRSTLIRFCTMLTNNGYNFVDATGQGTKWGKINRQFLMSDFTLQDSPIQALQLLLAFKLCYYVSLDVRWQREYDYLITDESFRYIDLISLFWKRILYSNYNIDYKHQIGFNHLNQTISYTDSQIIRHVMHSFHYSDDQEALLAFYLIFQLEDKREYKAKLREGLEGFWVSISRGQNPLWYLIYQLCYPDTPMKDYFGNNVVDVAAWQLSRTPIDTRKTAAFVEGSRDDVIIEGLSQVKQLSVNPNKIIGRRKQKQCAGAVNRTINYNIKADYDPLNIYDNKVLPADQRSIHKFNAATFDSIYASNPNSMEAATIFTLPYWLGVYHKMIQLD